MCPRETLRAAHLHAHFGRDDDARTVAATFHPLADDGFGLAALVSRRPSRIDVCGVDEIKTGSDKSIEQLERPLPVGGPAEHIAAETQWIHFQARMAELTQFHRGT